MSERVLRKQRQIKDDLALSDLGTSGGSTVLQRAQVMLQSTQKLRCTRMNVNMYGYVYLITRPSCCARMSCVEA